MNWIKRSLELCEKATPGPWQQSYFAPQGATIKQYTSREIAEHRAREKKIVRGPGIVGEPSCNPVLLMAEDENRDFVIDARTNFPRALRLLEQVKPILEKFAFYLECEGTDPGYVKQLLSELEGE